MSFERISKHKNCRFNRNLDWILLNPNQKRLLTTGCCRDGCYHLRCYCWRDGGADCVSKRPIPAAIHRVSRSAIPFSFPALEFSTVYKKRKVKKKNQLRIDRSINVVSCVCNARDGTWSDSMFWECCARSTSVFLLLASNPNWAWAVRNSLTDSPCCFSNSFFFSAASLICWDQKEIPNLKKKNFFKKRIEKNSNLTLRTWSRPAIFSLSWATSLWAAWHWLSTVFNELRSVWHSVSNYQIENQEKENEIEKMKSGQNQKEWG